MISLVRVWEKEECHPVFTAIIEGDLPELMEMWKSDPTIVETTVPVTERYGSEVFQTTVKLVTAPQIAMCWNQIEILRWLTETTKNFTFHEDCRLYIGSHQFYVLLRKISITQ